MVTITDIAAEKAKNILRSEGKEHWGLRIFTDSEGGCCGVSYGIDIDENPAEGDHVLEKNGLSGKDVDCFIAHQANRRIITATAERLGMPLDKVIINIDRFGNTTAGTIPLAMETALQEKKLKNGDLVLLAAVGAGFTSGATLVRWSY